MKELILLLFFTFDSPLLLEQGQAALASAQTLEHPSADTPKTTVLGNSFVAPKDWSVRVKGPATILVAPEGDSWVSPH